MRPPTQQTKTSSTSRGAREKRTKLGRGAVKPAHEQFLHGSRGSRVVPVPQAFVNALHRTGLLAQIRQLIDGSDPLLDAVAMALVLAALESGSGVGSRPAPRSEVVAQSTHREITTRALADQLDITTRAVVQAINDKRLAARRGADGRWWITKQDADTFASQRRETAA